MPNKNLQIGKDIQIRRNCFNAVIENTGALIDSGWPSSAEIEAVALALVKRIEHLNR